MPQVFSIKFLFKHLLLKKKNPEIMYTITYDITIDLCFEL